MQKPITNWVQLELELYKAHLQNRVLIAAVQRLLAAIKAHQSAKSTAADATDANLYAVLKDFEQP